MPPGAQPAARRRGWAGDFFTGDFIRIHDGHEHGTGQAVKLVALYGNDTWKVTPRVTLTYGVRGSLTFR
jgi:hypothetical protein